MKKNIKQAHEWTVRHIRKGWEQVKPHPSMSPWQIRLRYGLIAGGIAAASSVIFFGFYVLVLLVTLPDPGDLRAFNLTESTLIMDRKGDVLYAIHGDENRQSLSELKEVSTHLIDATLAIEDDQFYDHIGIDIPALGRAVLSEIGIGSPRGGSTITQQFVKNSMLSSEHSYKRKVKEIVLALLLEVKFSKDEILLMYLNAIPYGSNAYGIELAAERYFDKAAKELSLAEAAVLASIPKAPTHYSPYGNYRYTSLNLELLPETLGDREITGEKDLEYEEFSRGLIGKTFTMPDGSTFYMKGRSDLVLDRMEELGLITESEKTEALAEIQTLVFQEPKDAFPASHFVLWVKQILEEKYGSEVVEQGGLKVYTTLDMDYQKAAEESVAARKDSNTNNYGASNAALVSVDPKTGQILAMVGSADYRDENIDGQVNMITSRRQPGSSFKPFIYALAFLNRVSPGTILYDVSTDFGGGYKPNNYDGSFSGPVSVRFALGHSLNIPAIKAYFLAGGEEALVPFVNKFGFDSITLDKERPAGPSLALGTGEVEPLEMAESYSVFANGGTHVDLTPFLKIENAKGDILEQWEEKKIEKTEVLDPQVAFLINDILSDPRVGLGPNIRIDSLDNAAKTGTSTKPDNKLPNNNWIAAYTPSNVTIVWTGNSKGEAMKSNADGYTTAAPIWKGFMTKILDKQIPTVWSRPEGIKEIAVSKASGNLPSESTPSDMVTTDLFASFSVPTEIDSSYKTVQIESITNRLATEFSPEDVVTSKSFRIYHSSFAKLFPTWQTAIDAWASGLSELPPAESASDIHNSVTQANAPEISITSPQSLSNISSEDRLADIELLVSKTGNGIDRVEFYVNDQLQYTSKTPPYSGTIRLPTNAIDGTILNVMAKAVDVYGYSNTSSIQVRVSAPEPATETKTVDVGGEITPLLRSINRLQREFLRP